MPGRRQRLGQHMLVDRKILEKIVQAASISGNETVCEAGTGLGILTSELCRRSKIVMSYEVDGRLYERAKMDLKFDNLELVNRDLFRTRDVRFDVFVSNLPYSRSRDAIEWLATRKFKRAVIMVQQEFADKLMATPGAHDYRAVSALASHCFEIEVITHVASSSFYPRPAVQSAVLRLVQVRTMQEQAIKKLNWLFSKRNKRASAVSEKLGLGSSVYGEKRIDQLGADELVEMAVRANDLHAG